MARTKKKQRIITDGGYTDFRRSQRVSDGMGLRTMEPTIVLQMPELFYFDMTAYVASINSAKAIDFYNRARLYDMYESALLDNFLSGIIDKRRIGVSRIPIEFRRDGKPVEEVNREIRSPWFRKFVKDVLMSKFWGFGLFQFYRGEDGYIKFYQVPYKHFDPVKKEILRMQNDTTGIPLSAFENTLYVADSDRGLGMLAELVPMVLYKRGNMADWAQFCQIFGMPIREYTYDAGDEEARRRLLEDARQQGANAVYIHPKESSLNLVESANKSGTVDLYERFKDACNKEMSIRVLGNTLTTDAQRSGTQALGTVHQEEEDMLKADDRDFILDVLNYDMTDIFQSLGVNTEGGEFVYMKDRVLNPTQQVDVIQKAKSMGLPISDDYMYDVLQIDKPEDYEQMKAEIKAKEEADRQLREQMANQLESQASQVRGSQKNPLEQPKKEPTGSSLTNRIRHFFGLAPLNDGAPLPF